MDAASSTGAPVGLGRLRQTCAQASGVCRVETDGGRDILRAAGLTPDPLLRRCTGHAIDELHHGSLFRGAALCSGCATRSSTRFNGNPRQAAHGLDDLRIGRRTAGCRVLHIAEGLAGRFPICQRLVDDDRRRAIFERFCDEVFQ